jgi:EAL domain-containing protein (putative c-di-GMP-specific phosphodiesterase class I)
VLGRIGDTQFGILLTAPAGTSDIARRVGLYTRAIDRPYSLGHRSTDVTLDISACFGVAQFPGDGDDAESIIAHATAACDVARGRGRRAVVFFDPLLERDHQLRRSAVAELRQAIAERQFVTYYQPIVDIATDRVVGAESLVRWKHPTRGIVLPGTFLPLAGEAGLISEIDALVARTSIGDIRALAGGDPVFRLYINLVADRMKADDIVATLLTLLRDFGVSPRSFGVEITETTAMNDVMQSRIILERFRREGIFVALDDFGTGFSSLGYLKTFPIDVLKIDRSFIEGLPDDRGDAALVESIAAIAKIFGFSLHAEGVQNERQRAWLRARGCETMQGFAYGEPMPRETYLAWRDARRLATAAP